jgi:hypothetical protein
MYDNRLEKTIDELDPIPDNWTAEQRKKFIDTGYLAMAGETQQAGITRTKKVSVDDLHRNLSSKNSTLMVESAATLVADGTFVLRKLRSGGPELVVSGTDVQLPPGWYTYTARATFTFNGTPINRCMPIEMTCNLHNRNQKSIVDFDFSYPHTEQLVLADMVFNNGSPDDPERVADTDPLNTYRKLNMSISGTGASGASGVSVTLLLSVSCISVAESA